MQRFVSQFAVPPAPAACRLALAALAAAGSPLQNPDSNFIPTQLSQHPEAN